MALFKIDEKKKPLVTWIAIVAIVGSLVSIFFTQCERPPKINMKPYLAIGQVMAEETSKLISNKGEIVVVVMDSKKFKTPTIDAQLSTFQETLKKQGGIHVAATEAMSMEKMGMMHGPEMGMPGEMFLQILEKHPNVAAVVSFVGPPSLKDDEISKLPQNIPKVVAFSSMGMGLKKLFEENVIQVAIVPRFDMKPQEHKKEPVTLRDWFDQYYSVVTAETASSLPF
ncbi:MAG: hypothetical protein HY360_10480 [Verrucomicrobia bacterium]|nr:hypothetical protein [Verrucomicrobiota bacterium]